jgi:hypothetical protein
MMSQHALSPLWQVMHTPSLVGSHVQMPQVRLHSQTVIPFSVQQQLHIPSQRALHRFCNVAHETSSSHAQSIFMPPAHRETFIVQRGTTHQLPVVGAGAAPAEFAGEKPAAPNWRRSRIALLIAKSFRC